MIDSIVLIEKILDTNYELESSAHLPINEKVIFPNAKAESMGMEDVRFVKFEDGEQVVIMVLILLIMAKQYKNTID